MILETKVTYWLLVKKFYTENGLSAQMKKYVNENSPLIPTCDDKASEAKEIRKIEVKKSVQANFELNLS